ncbi:hypothetical protein OY671_012902, partial [Metschnikowia pulcherrima]
GRGRRWQHHPGYRQVGRLCSDQFGHRDEDRHAVDRCAADHQCRDARTARRSGPA